MTLRPHDCLADEFARYAKRWAAERGAATAVIDSVGLAAAALSRATSAGHVCVYLADIAVTDGSAGGGIERLRSALQESGLLGSPTDPGVLPFVLDADDRLYLHRYFDYETRLARNLLARTTPEVAALAAEAPVDWQQVAVASALQRRLTVISGGPGTGKTTVIVNLLARLLEQNPECRIVLAAPTGKAAARITETIRQRAVHLPEHLRARLPQTASTVHRLLRRAPDGGFVHDASNLLPIDVLVVDEASMLDLALATQLFEAVPPAAKLVLVGDKDQLAAVESGAVFADVSADPRISVELRHNYRFGAESAIGRLAVEINAGEPAAVLARLRARASTALSWIDDEAPSPSAELRQALSAGFAGYVDTCRTGPLDPGAVTRAFAQFRVLCAVREGQRGTVAINERVGRLFRRALEHPLDRGRRTDWYPGRPVVVLRNAPMLQLFNGDIGIALPDAGGNLAVYFPDPQSGFRAVAPMRLPDHETAFAMTVHKAQGSEFDRVLLLLPAKPNRVLTRELLYTGVTRAREHVTLVGGADVVERAVRAATVRLSGLAARLGSIGQNGKLSDSAGR